MWNYLAHLGRKQTKKDHVVKKTFQYFVFLDCLNVSEKHPVVFETKKRLIITVTGSWEVQKWIWDQSNVLVALRNSTLHHACMHWIQTYIKRHHIERIDTQTKLLHRLDLITYDMTFPSILTSIHSSSFTALWPSPAYIPLLPSKRGHICSAWLTP